MSPQKFTALRQTLEQTNQDQRGYARLCGCTNQGEVVFGREAVEDGLQASAPPIKCEPIFIGEMLEI
jgi:hypothetical protein